MKKIISAIAFALLILLAIYLIFKPKKLLPDFATPLPVDKWIPENISQDFVSDQGGKITLKFTGSDSQNSETGGSFFSNRTVHFYSKTINAIILKNTKGTDTSKFMIYQHLHDITPKWEIEITIDSFRYITHNTVSVPESLSLQNRLFSGLINYSFKSGFIHADTFMQVKNNQIAVINLNGVLYRRKD